MKCHECNQKARWVVIDQSPYEDLFLPLCEEHFEELRGMEGEMNLDFELLDDVSDYEGLLDKANEKWRWMNKRYQNLLNLYSDLKDSSKQSQSTEQTEASK